MNARVIALLLCTASGVSAARAAPPTRAEMMKSAAAYAEMTWQAAPHNADGCRPPWRSDYGTGRHVGMAYKWGGFDDIDAYHQRLSEGAGAGSHQQHGVLDCATGIDCSGFVSRVWGLPTKRGTATLAEVSVPISISALEPGDVLNKSGSHVVLFAARNPDGTPQIYEASGSAGRVQFRSASWAQLHGYRALRSRALLTASCVGSPDAPIRVTSLPFVDHRDTSRSCSDRFDAYSCAPSKNESGPEVVYAVTVPRRGVIVAHVDAGPGVDADVHLLDGPDARLCRARDDRSVAHVVSAGEYFLAVDTWVGANGREKDGAYVLTLHFEPE